MNPAAYFCEICSYSLEYEKRTEITGAYDCHCQLSDEFKPMAKVPDGLIEAVIPQSTSSYGLKNLRRWFDLIKLLKMLLHKSGGTLDLDYHRLIH